MDRFIHGSAPEPQEDYVLGSQVLQAPGFPAAAVSTCPLLDASPEAGQQHLAFSGTAQTARGVWVSYDPASDMTLVFSNTDDTGTANLRIKLTGEQQFSPATSSP